MISRYFTRKSPTPEQIEAARQMLQRDNPEWCQDCLRQHGRILVGSKSHYCDCFDGMPIDQTCDEIRGCTCD